MKIHDMGRTLDNEQWIAFHCPGCGHAHSIPVTGPRGWHWNGSVDTPTITPSLLVNPGGGNPTAPVCHSIITDGKINFQSDSTHALAGQTVDMPDWKGA